MYVETWQLVCVGGAVIVLGIGLFGAGKYFGIKRFCAEFFDIERIGPERNGLTLFYRGRGATVHSINASIEEIRSFQAKRNAENLLETIRHGGLC